ncbi:MAG: histidine phosphatase family protein, partial [Gammaproteobacteria bacterium]|nr:histidine phosphatase family protein [Gammaproteobacteria bacterium]
ARGRRDAASIGAWLRTQSFTPDVIYSSPAQRAAETARAIVTGAGFSSEIVHWDKQLYLASLDILLQFIADIPATQQHVLLIGHNPGLEELLLYLADDAEGYVQRGKLLTTANFVRLALPKDWADLAQHCARISQFIRPRDLPTDANS